MLWHVFIPRLGCHVNNALMNQTVLPFLERSWIIAGPTASGKSEMAMELAGRINGEIVSVDSMTIFRELDIGTAKPTVSDRLRIPHHLIDILDPRAGSSVADWLLRCTKCLSEILNRGKVPILVGGTGLYWKTLFFGLPSHPGGDPALRKKWENEIELRGSAAAHARLLEVDPIAARKIHPTDSRRIIRAMEVWELTGQPISSGRPDWGAAMDVRPIPPNHWIWIAWPRTTLRSRIDQRVHKMIELGWEKEAIGLSERNAFGPQSVSALGYKTLCDGSNSGLGREEIIQRIVRETCQFAKRQETWLRSMPMIRPVPLKEGISLPETLNRILDSDGNPSEVN